MCCHREFSRLLTCPSHQSLSLPSAFRLSPTLHRPMLPKCLVCAYFSTLLCDKKFAKCPQNVCAVTRTGPENFDSFSPFALCSLRIPDVHYKLTCHVRRRLPKNSIGPLGRFRYIAEGFRLQEDDGWSWSERASNKRTVESD